jgi:surface antigen Omp85-like protein
MLKKVKLILIFILIFGKSWGQDSTRQSSFIPLPIVFYTPETSWGFGGVGIYSFHFKKDSINSRPSQIQLGAAYTLRNQILVYLPFQLFLKNGKYKVYGELGYYRYIYEFSGIGNEGHQDESELYSVDFPRLRLNILQQVQPNLFVGLRYWMDDFNITQTEEDGLLENADITGAQGGFLSGLGIVANYDTRDKIFYPSRGLYAESLVFFNNNIFGSDFNYTKYIFDGSAYFQNKWRHILALNIYAEMTSGDPPFNQLSLLGGNKRMRGYFEGEYRDKQYVSFQAEYRMHLFWRIGAVFFVGSGMVESDFKKVEVNNIKYVIGVGLRFLLDEKQKVNFRFDAGFGKNTSGLYVTVSEAF